IQILPTNFDNYIQIRLKKIFGKEAKIDFFERLNISLLEVVDEIQESNHSKILQGKLIEAVFICRDSIDQILNDVKSSNAITTLGKITFNLKKVEVLLLLQQMYLHKIIDNSITPIKLFGLVNQYFTYSGKKQIRNSYTDIQEYKDGRKKDVKAL